MRIEISYREVLNNLIHFKESLSDWGEKKAFSQERVYKVLLNRKNGDMRFPQKIKSLEHQIVPRKGKADSARDWKEALILVLRDNENEPICFRICDLDRHEIKPSDVENLAWRVIEETLQVLNQRAKQVLGFEYGMLPERAVLQDLSFIHLSIPPERIEDLPSWMGPLNRENAERSLEGQPEGTYLIREGDHLTQAIGFHFSEENHLSVRLYVLTVVEEGDKISDILVVKTPRGWTLYHDDPNLNDSILYKYESNPQDILNQMDSFAKTPIHRIRNS